MKNGYCKKTELKVNIYEFEDPVDKVITVTDSNENEYSLVLSGQLATNLIESIQDLLKKIKD